VEQDVQEDHVHHGLQDHHEANGVPDKKESGLLFLSSHQSFKKKKTQCVKRPSSRTSSSLPSMQWRHRAHYAAKTATASDNHKALFPPMYTATEDQLLPNNFKHETKMTSRLQPATTTLGSRINVTSTKPLELQRAMHPHFLRLATISAQDINAHYLHQLQVSFKNVWYLTFIYSLNWSDQPSPHTTS
jgi:hypothetical protein